MTTTPAPTEIDTLKALLDAMPEGPWRAALSQPSPGIRTAAGWEVVHASYDDHLSVLEFIAAARNALPALLDELAKLRREVADANLYGHEMAGKVVDLCRDMGVVQAELAKTRAELDEQRQAAHDAVRGLGNTIADLAEASTRAAAGRGEAERDLEAARSELDRLRATNGCPSCAASACDEYIHLSSAHIGDLVEKLGALSIENNDTRIALAEAKTLLAEYVDGEYPHRRAKQLLAANPATTAEPAACLGKPLCSRGCCGPEVATAEPADEPKATCHLPVQNGEPCGLVTCRKHGCRVAPKAEPAAS